MKVGGFGPVAFTPSAVVEKLTHTTSFVGLSNYRQTRFHNLTANLGPAGNKPKLRRWHRGSRAWLRAEDALEAGRYREALGHEWAALSAAPMAATSPLTRNRVLVLVGMTFVGLIGGKGLYDKLQRRVLGLPASREVPTGSEPWDD
jgi:hypothetical protein